MSLKSASGERLSGDKQPPKSSLQRSEERLRLAVEAAGIGTYDFDFKTQEAVWSPHLYRLIGADPDTDEDVGQLLLERIHPDDKAGFFARMDGLERGTGDGQFSFEFRIVLPNGETRWLRDVGRVFFESEKGARRATRSVGAVQDVTEHRRATQAERDAIADRERQSRLFDGVVSTTPDFVYLFDLEGRFLYANRRLLEVWGMELPAVIGKTCLELGYEPWHHEMHMREIAQVIATKAPIKGEVPFRAPLTGVFGVYEYIFTPVIGADGEVELVAGTTRDVTERKQAEEAHRASEARLGALVAASSDVIYRMSADWTEMQPIDGRNLVKSNDAPIRDWLERNIPEWEHARIRESIATAIADRTPFMLEHQVYRPDGSLGWTYSRAVPIIDERGEITEWFGAASDISRRKEAEAALEMSEARLRLATESAQVGIWEYDFRSDTGWWSPETLELTGERRSEFKIEDWIRAVHPADRSEVAAAWEKALELGEPYEAQFRAAEPGPDGQDRWLLSRGRVERDADGQPLRAAGVLFDVTARRRAEAALSEREQQLRVITDAMPALISYIDADERYRFVNLQYERWFGRRREEVLGCTMEEVLGASAVASLRPHIDAALRGEPVQFEIETPYEAAGTRWIDARYLPDFDPAGNVVGFFVLVLDITARKEAEQVRERAEVTTRFILELNQTLLRASTEREAIESAAELVGKFFSVDHVHVNELAADVQTMEVLFDWRATDDGINLNGFGPVQLSDFVTEEFQARLRAGDVLVIEDTQTDPVTIPHAEMQRQLRHGSIIHAPYLSHGQVAFGLAMTTHKARHYREDEVSALREAAVRLFGVIERIRANEARARSEERLRVLLQVSDAARAQADPDAIVAAALETFRQELNADRIAWAEVEDDEDHFTFAGCVSAPGVSIVQGRYHVSAFGLKALAEMRAGRPVVVNDVEVTEDEVDFAAYRAIGAQSLVAAPIHRDGRFIAGIGVHSKQPRQWTEAEIELTQLVAERIWEALERARAEHALAASEARFRYLADAVPHLVWTVRRDGTATYYNQQVRAYRGIRSPEESPNGEWDWSPGLHPDDLESTLAKWQAAIEGREPYEVEHRILMNDGTYRWHLSRAFPAGGLDAPIWFGTSTDIHDLKEAESARRESEERLRFALDSAQAGSFDIPIGSDAIPVVTSTVSQLFGFSANELPTTADYLARVHPEDQAAVQRAIDSSFARNEPHAVEYRLVRPDGSEVWIGSRAMPVLGPDGRPERLVGILFDITARRHAQEELERLSERAAFLANAVENASQPFGAALPDGRLLSVNRAFLELTGYTEDEIIQLDWAQELTPPEWHPVEAAAIQRLEESGLPQLYRKEYRRKDGTRVPIEVKAHKIVDGTGQAIYYGFITDITERLAAEAAIRESEERFRTMANGVPLVIWVHDAEGNQVFVNQTFCDYFGVTREEMLAGKWQVLTHPDDGTHYVESFMKAVAERRSFHAEVRVKRFDGEWRWIESWGRPRFASDGTFLGIVGTSADITDRKEVERRTKQLNEELEAKVATRTAELLATNAQLQGFTYSVAHDLRQQIRGINVNASILLIELAQNLDDGNRETLARLVASSKQLGRLVDDLLAYARLGKQEPTRVPLDLTSLSEEVVSVVIERGGTRQGTRFTIGRDLMGYGDGSMMRLVLENLIDNACKYSADVVQPHIEIGRSEDAFYVRDNGIGFDMQYAHKLFEPFERLHRESEYAGTGIGLANVKRIIEKHGGRVWAEGRPGAGATFFFTLPSTDES